MTYELSEQCVTRTNADGSISYIPLDPANSDYQIYLESLKPEADEAKAK